MCSLLYLNRILPFLKTPDFFVSFGVRIFGSVACSQRLCYSIFSCVRKSCSGDETNGCDFGILSVRAQAMFLSFFIKLYFGKASQTPGHVVGDSKQTRGYQNKTNENQMPPVADFVFFH